MLVRESRCQIFHNVSVIRYPTQIDSFIGFQRCKLLLPLLQFHWVSKIQIVQILECNNTCLPFSLTGDNNHNRVTSEMHQCPPHLPFPTATTYIQSEIEYTSTYEYTWMKGREGRDLIWSPIASNNTTIK